ncbi:hypothetical protein QJU43_08925 [Pasteurella atlantica]|uniref:hypothetical protein n=2 Tax=Pasteurellales TaxID=135625 RepID=UPI002777862F|nr:hypothetical protein [Pasteurella atlantica]MDP8035263.1 hypothetical protein [Pasteurella atlantica]MDP8037214.1 hypothetical protein [Pasteurella atlantica]MDP8047673.1 hypothetical protein [Pasteurella atlantica]MDP8049516.1 hypothetical protein [Pasteurella atlantica]MDP8053542.1 hypothetical protein [Pasteurella atlantica]
MSATYLKELTDKRIDTLNQWLQGVEFGTLAGSIKVVEKLSTEEAMLNRIWNLKEVQASNQYIVNKSNGKRKLKLLISKSPSEIENTDYCIKVVEDNGTNYVTHYNFVIYPESGKIMYLDAITGEEIELADWRKSQDQ